MGLRLKHICCFVLPAIFVGCSDDSYRGRLDEMLPDTDKLPVMVSLGDPTGNIISGKASTKGTGEVDSASDLMGEGRYLYVYGLSSTYGTYLLKGEEKTYSCLIDASVDTPGAVGGRRAKASGDNAFVEWVDSDKPVYWPSGEMGAIPYDFFAYYIDDIQLTPSDYERTDDRIAIRLKIDGSNDIMSGKAVLTQKQLSRFSGDEKTKVQKFAYSYYTALREVTPTIVLNHDLVRLDFVVTPGVTLGINKEMAISRVSVESLTEAKFTVAAQDQSLLGLDFSGEAEKLYLTESDGTPFVPVTFFTRDSESAPAESMELGGSFFLAPSDVYPLRMEVSEKYGGNESQGENPIPVPLSAEGGFQPGTRYKVNMTVIGFNNIAVSVSIVPWQDGGGMIVDKGDEAPGTE